MLRRTTADPENYLRYLTYNLLMYLLSPLWLLVTARQAIQRKGGLHFVFTRMGWRKKRHSTVNQARTVAVQTQSATSQTLWLHAASVGEVKSILPLLDHISTTWPLLSMHVTCTTPESLGILKKSKFQKLTSEYCPIDFYRSTNTLFKQLNPLALLIVETEIWPNLYRAASHHNVPLVIINGRASDRTLNAPAFVLNLYRQVLPHVTLILSRSKMDTANLKQLGINDSQIRTIGNIKTYAGVTTQATAVTELKDKRYLLAASTHAPEELQLCEALMGTDLLLVIAPRHVQRSNNIQQMLSEKNIPFATRSHSEAVTAATRVYLADTTGEIDRLITNADMVFVGGSLVDRGGHNVLEPAAQGKPVITGPHYKNFMAEVELLSAYNAIRIVTSAGELISVYKKFIEQPSELKTMGQSAKQAIESSQHVFEHYTSEIDQIIDQHS